MLEVFQARRGYRFGVETLLLCGFVEAGSDSMVDLGTGSGIIPLVLTRFGKAARAVGVEIQPALADRARRSVAHNRLADRVEIVEADLKALDGVLPAAGFDLVTSNPPYRPAGNGNVATEPEKARAKHELLCTLEDVVAVAGRLLRPRGRFVVIVPPERLEDLLGSCRSHGLRPARLRMVHGRAELPASHCLLDAVRGGRNQLVGERPLIVYENQERYTEEVQAMLYPEV